MNVLIIGGNRFFGKKLADKLILSGDKVTLLNRGNIDDGFDDKVSRITCDRTDFNKMEELLKEESWDLIYDQVCYTYDQAKQACQLFNGKTKKYIHTSTVSVYETHGVLKETDFNPSEHNFNEIVTDSKMHYGEAKRQAECAFTKFAKFPLTMLRIPIVVGLDDYTGRLLFHINKIKNEEEFYMPMPEAKVAFITSDDAANVLFKLGKSDFTGIINAASPKPIELREFISILENKFNRKAKLKIKNDSLELHSPYGFSNHCQLDTEKLSKLNIKLTDIGTWFKNLNI